MPNEAQRYSVFLNDSPCFGWYDNPSSGAQTTVSTASSICHTVTATSNIFPTRRNVTRFFKRLYMFRVVPPPIIRSANNCIYSIWYLSHRYCYLPLAAGSNNGVTNTRCCRYSRLRSWWWVVVPPETCRAVSRKNKLCNVASCWTYIRIEYKTELLPILALHQIICSNYRSPCCLYCWTLCFPSAGILK